MWKVCGYTIWDVVEMYREDKLHSESLKSVFKKFRVPKVPGVEETLVQYMEMSFAFMYLVNLSVCVKFSLSLSVFVKDVSS